MTFIWSLTTSKVVNINRLRLFFLDIEAQDRAMEAYKDRRSWARKSILASSGMGKFSSDRTIKEYAEQIWNLKVKR